MKRVSFPLALLLITVLSHLPSVASACTVCMGDPNSKTASAMNGALFLMLGFVAFMLISVGTFAFHLFRRAQSPLPPYAEVAQMMSNSHDAK